MSERRTQAKSRNRTPIGLADTSAMRQEGAVEDDDNGDSAQKT